MNILRRIILILIAVLMLYPTKLLGLQKSIKVKIVAIKMKQIAKNESHLSSGKNPK